MRGPLLKRKLIGLSGGFVFHAHERVMVVAEGGVYASLVELRTPSRLYGARERRSSKARKERKNKDAREK